jgi:hypothetical protein
VGKPASVDRNPACKTPRAGGKKPTQNSTSLSKEAAQTHSVVAEASGCCYVRSRRAQSRAWTLGGKDAGERWTRIVVDLFARKCAA